MINKKTEGQGQDIVVFHGWGCDHRHMEPIVKLLSSTYRVTAIDLPGRGQSDWDSAINNIHGIADLLLTSLPANAIYIAWSFGGLVTFSIAARYPERVKRIIGIATSPKFVEGNDWIGIPVPGFKAAYPAIEKLGFHNFIKAFFDAEFKETELKSTAYDELMKIHQATPPQDITAFLKGIEICDATDLRAEFQNMQCPVDIIFGENDSAIPIESHQLIKKLNSKAKLHIISDAQHMPFWTHEDVFNRELQNILNHE